MLQQIENACLGILRVTVIITAGILLLSALIFGASSLRGMLTDPTAEARAIEVSASQVLGKVKAPGANQGDRVARPEASRQELEDSSSAAADPNKADYDRTVQAFSSIVKIVSGNEYSLDANRSYEMVSNRANGFKDPKIVADFARGQADMAEQALADSSFLADAKNRNVVETIDDLLNTYLASFKAALEEERLRRSNEEAKRRARMAAAPGNLTFAAASFALALISMFLLIFIKMERSLRNLEKESRQEANSKP